MYEVSNCKWFPPLIFIICSFLLYIQTFSGTWLIDDFPVIVNNPDIRSLGNFITNSFPGRPLREISYLLDYSLFGLDPYGYHFQNICWHALNCWLIYYVAIRLNLSSTVAWLSSMLFLAHPINVEVAANSSHRKDSLALAFILMAFLAYTKVFEQRATSRRVLWLAATLLLWITAFFAKGNSLVFPAIAIAYEYALIPEENRLLVKWRQMVPVLSVSFIIALIPWYLYISGLPSFKMTIIGAFIKTENLASFSTAAYILMVLKSFAFMLSKLILPVNLSMEYIYDVPKSLFDPWVLATLLLIPAFCFVAYRWRRSSPQLFFLLSFAAILWLPTANIAWHLSYFAADRYMYPPLSGLCILAALVSERAFPASRKYFVFGWICILVVFATVTWKQTRVWHNEMTLHHNMLKVSPRSLEAMIGLSNAYYAEKNYDMAVNYARQAIQRDFTDHRPYMMLGNISFLHNRLDEALDFFLEAQRKNPLSPEVHNSLGSVYDNLGRPDQAVLSFKTALKLRPDYFQANTNLGVTFERMNNLLEADSALNRAIAANPDYAPAWYNLGIVRYKKNDMKGARQAFFEAARLNPSDTDALTNLSIVCKELGDVGCFNDAVQRMGSNVPTVVEKLRQQ